MTSHFLEQIGLAGLDIGILILVLFVILLITLIILIVTAAKLSSLQRKYDSFMKGRGGRSLEAEIRNLFYDIDYLKDSAEAHERTIRHLYKRLETVYQKIGIVKYDAFHQMGGKLSFALALLDENNNGFLLNSVHSSDGSYCYVKEIKDSSCEIELSSDEQKALDQALSCVIPAAPARERKKKAEPESRTPARSQEPRRKQPAYSEEDYDEYEDEPEAYEDEAYDNEAYDEDAYDDPDLLEAEQVINNLSGRHKVVADDDFDEGVVSYTTGKRRKR